MTGDPPSSPEPRFLCDEMLARLARLLRAAGYDAALARPGTPDGALLAEARADGRLLLTRDHALAARAGQHGRLLPESRDEQAAELARACGVDWLHAPFTRCLVDDAPLAAATAEAVAAAPPAARAGAGPFRTCPICGRLYWPGGHVRRMTRALERLASAANDSGGRANPVSAGSGSGKAASARAAGS